MHRDDSVRTASATAASAAALCLDPPAPAATAKASLDARRACAEVGRRVGRGVEVGSDGVDG